jgi:WD40 repeat protein
MVEEAAKFFQVGGTLDEDARSYIERPADTQLLEQLDRGQLCLVIAPRQTGKSSLVVRALKRLGERGAHSCYVDFQPFGTETDPDRFFNSLMSRVGRELKLKTDVRAWNASRLDLSPTIRFGLFVEEVVLAECEGTVILAFDEVDSILKLPFSDDFFTTIRALYNARASNRELRRLRFILLGVASKSVFIKDSTRTPFNVGVEISLTDFDRADTEPFELVLGDDSGQLIDRIFYWTSGQPILVQALAATACKWPPGERTPARLDQEVERTFHKQMVRQDTHFKFIRDYLLSEPTLLRQMLLIYADVLTGLEVNENTQSPAQERLKLAGVVRAERGRLLPRNRIYSNIFDYHWAEEQRPRTFADRPFISRVAIISAPLLLLSALFFLLRPHVYPRLPAPDREIYVESVAAAPKFKALDAARAYLDGREVAIEDGYLMLPFEPLRPGESTHRLRVEAECLVESFCFRRAREVEFKLIYYPGGEMRQLPDASLDSINPQVSVVVGRVLLRDASDGTLLTEVEGEAATAAILSTDRKRVLVGGTVRLWRIILTTSREAGMRAFLDHVFSDNKGGGAVSSLAFGPDDSTFVSGHGDGSLINWVVRGDLRYSTTVKIFAGPVNAVLYGRSGLVASARGSTPTYYPGPGGEVGQVFRGHSGDVLCMAYSPDGRLLATGGEDGQVIIWDTSTGQRRRTLPDEAPVSAVSAVGFSPDGDFVLSASDSLTLWEAESGRKVRTFALSVERPDSVGFSANGLIFFAHSINGSLQVWDIMDTERGIEPFAGHVGVPTAVAFSPDGRKFASADDAGYVRLWEASTHRLRHTLDFVVAQAGGSRRVKVSDVAFAPDGRTLAAGGGRSVRMWDTESGQVLGSADAVGGDVSRVAFYQAMPRLTRAPGNETRVIIDPPLLAVAGSAGNLDFMEVAQPGDQGGADVTAPKPLQVVRNFLFKASINAVAFARDQRNTAAVGLENGTVEVFDAVTGEKRCQIYVPPGRPVHAVGFSPDGKRLASGSDSHDVMIWDTDTGDLVESLDAEHTGEITGVAFSPNGEKLISGSSDATLCLWDVKSGSVVRRFTRHAGGVTGVAFSNDGNRVISSASDYTLKFWWAGLPDVDARR